MTNVKTIIHKHNDLVLSKTSTRNQPQQPQPPPTCNCRDKDDCPIPGNCLVLNVIYKVEITTTDNADTKQYVCMTSDEFKTRYRNHTKSFRDKKYANETELSKHVWELKKTCRNYEIKWSILKRVPAHKEGTKRCILCLEEKLKILKASKAKLLNKRSEIIPKCRHVNTHYLWNARRKMK